MGPIARALLSVSLLIAAPASGEIFRWTDADGRLHFTQSLDQVPAAHREEARKRAEQQAPRRVQTYESALPAAAARQRSGRVLRIPFQRHGQVMKVTARLNDHLEAPFLIDTGASGVSLPAWVAQRLGIHVGPDTPGVFVSTANGVVQLPVVTLDSVQLGDARVERLQATVNPSLDVGLLGGAFFNNFVYGVDAAASVITLSPNDSIVAGLDETEWRRRFAAVRGPLEELERYLDEREISRDGRRAELEARRAELRAMLAELEREATRAGVPAAWRD